MCFFVGVGWATCCPRVVCALYQTYFNHCVLLKIKSFRLPEKIARFCK
ncbi:MAG: hypothetical protein IKI11_03065 [Neisseriaceae bacterium]|nr:hypothetical protein [Neisseriaceae bacterium]